MNLLTFWYEALASKFGIVLAVSDPALAKARLYAVRKENGDPDLDAVSIRTSPLLPSEELWLVKQTKPATKQKTEFPDGAKS